MIVDWRAHLQREPWRLPQIYYPTNSKQQWDMMRFLWLLRMYEDTTAYNIYMCSMLDHLEITLEHARGSHTTVEALTNYCREKAAGG